MNWPVIHRASSQARKATTSAMSSGVPSRPRAVLWIMCCLTSGGNTARDISVSVTPGATAFTVTFFGDDAPRRLGELHAERRRHGPAKTASRCEVVAALFLERQSAP